MAKGDRTKTVVMMCILSRQLQAWLQHARDLGHMSKAFKYEGGKLLNQLNGFNKFLDKGAGDMEDDVLFEESAKYSDLIELLLTLDEKDMHRVSSLIEKINREKLKVA